MYYLSQVFKVKTNFGFILPFIELETTSDHLELGILENNHQKNPNLLSNLFL